MIVIIFLKKDILKAVGKTPITHGPFLNNLLNKDPKAFKMVKGIGRCIDHKDLFNLAKNCERDVIGAILTHCVLNK